MYNLVKKPMEGKKETFDLSIQQSITIFHQTLAELQDPNLIADFTDDVTFFVAPSLDTLSMSKLTRKMSEFGNGLSNKKQS